MDRDYISDHQLAERYLQGKMSGAERARFEEAYLSSDELLDELESAELLQQGLRDLSTLAQDRAPKQRPSWVMSMFGSPRYAMAASFLLLVSLGVSSVLLHQLGEAGGSALAGPAQIVSLVSVRSAPGAQTVNTIRLEAGSRQTVLMLDPGFGEFTRYRATVNRLSATTGPVPVWQVDGLQPGYEEMLALAVSTDVLEPGEYRVTVEGWTSDQNYEIVDTVSFQVVRPAPGT